MSRSSKFKCYVWLIFRFNNKIRGGVRGVSALEEITQLNKTYLVDVILPLIMELESTSLVPADPMFVLCAT